MSLLSGRWWSWFHRRSQTCRSGTGARWLQQGRSRPRLEYLEDRTVPSGVTLTELASQTAAALTSNAFVDIPGLATNVNSAGLYHVSASVNFSNTSQTTGTEIGLQLLANGQ